MVPCCEDNDHLGEFIDKSHGIEYQEYLANAIGIATCDPYYPYKRHNNVDANVRVGEPILPHRNITRFKQDQHDLEELENVFACCAGPMRNETVADKSKESKELVSARWFC